MLTKCSLRYAAVASSSKDSWAITWHQWHAAYPTLSRIGTLRRRATSNGSSPHSHQSTGLSRCWSRYGEVAFARRFGMELPALRVPGAATVWVPDAARVTLPGRVVARRRPHSLSWQREHLHHGLTLACGRLPDGPPPAVAVAGPVGLGVVG